MRRHYRVMTPAQRDAITDAKIARMEAAGIPLRDFAPRDPLVIVVEVDGQRFEVYGKPARRSNQFHLTLNGEPLGIGGAEAAWRAIQAKRAPLLGRRNCQ